MLSHLPFEIIELINQQLSINDKYQCLFTCHSWYRLFKFMLYQQCKISNRKSFLIYYHALEKDQQLCGQVKKLDLSQCDITEQEHHYILNTCTRLKEYSLRWDPSTFFLHDCTHLENINKNKNKDHHQKFSQVLHDQTMCNQPNLPVWSVNTTSSGTEHFRFSKNAYLSTLRLHDATIIGLLNIIKWLPYLKQLDLVSLKLDITIHDVEAIHLNCPQLSSLSFDVHALLSSSSSSSLSTFMDWSPSHTMKHLKLVYKHLEKPGKTPWVYYIKQKYPSLITLEMKTKYTRRNNYWQWNGNNLDEEHHHPQQQQQSMLDHMDDHPDFRLALKEWAQSCYYLTSIQFSGIPWDQWFFQHLPTLTTEKKKEKKINSPSLSYPTIKKIQVVRTNDNLTTASNIFWTLINHGSMIHLTNLSIRPVAIKPDLSFYEALSKLKSLEELTIQQQGICSNKQLLCQLDMQLLLYHCQSLKKISLGGLELIHWHHRGQKMNDHLQLEHLSLSTTRVDHDTLQQIIHSCPHLDKFYFISCEYDALLEYDIPTLEIGNPKQKWKEVHINYPFIQSSYQYNLQPIGLSGRRQCESPRFMTTNIYHHHHHEKKEMKETWFHLLPITNYYYFNRHQSNLTQQLIPSNQVQSLINTDQKNLSLRKEGLEFGRIKIIASSISNLFINGTRIIL